MIDTHLHVWQLTRGWYGWNGPELGPLHSDSALDDIAGELASADVESVVLVQAADHVAETDWLLTLAENDARVRGVVGYLPLSDRTALEMLLRTYAGRPLVGVRQLWHDHPDPGELASAAVLGGLRLVGEAGLAVDVPDAFGGVWPALRTAVERLPRTRFVLDHCGKPPFGDPLRWDAWEAAFTDLAASPTVIVKLSGLFGGSGSAVPARPDELARVVELCRAVAGAERTLLGSDWPMTRGHLGYAESLRRLAALLSGWSPAELEAVSRGTAEAVYRPLEPS
ncbi:MAG TPA: amidohydrolase family protein [Microlunatus sp.]|nr:amidohydrolase family protein [Microlunatus sp.]